MPLRIINIQYLNLIAKEQKRSRRFLFKLRNLVRRVLLVISSLLAPLFLYRIGDILNNADKKRDEIDD
jgi:hypothetical protein